MNNNIKYIISTLITNLILITMFGFLLYAGIETKKEYDFSIENHIEVEATIIDYKEEINDEGNNFYIKIYEYIVNDKTYKSLSNSSSSSSKELGNKEIIRYDPKDPSIIYTNDSSQSTMLYILALMVFICAIFINVTIFIVFKKERLKIKKQNEIEVLITERVVTYNNDPTKLNLFNIIKIIIPIASIIIPSILLAYPKIYSNNYIKTESMLITINEEVIIENNNEKKIYKNIYEYEVNNETYKYHEVTEKNLQNIGNKIIILAHEDNPNDIKKNFEFHQIINIAFLIILLTNTIVFIKRIIKK